MMWDIVVAPASIKRDHNGNQLWKIVDISQKGISITGHFPRDLMTDEQLRAMCSTESISVRVR
jgi:hypothetical protein